MFQILGMLSPFLKKFKYIAVLIVIFCLAYFVTWRWRQTFQPQWMYLAGAMGIATVIILIVIFVRWRHEKGMANGLEAGITDSDADKVDLKGEIKALRDNWNESLARLKESAGAKSAAATLYTLPWYIIIGEPASGKSTLLRKSGLDFPVGDASISGMHGTRNCDWWFANEAIFLDTAGRYIIETQEAEWVTFLGLLKKYRKKRPINGVLVAIAANSLLTKTHDELLDDAKRIRSRLDELIDELGINFPTYILVTKCDLISGFVEFFGPLDGRHRDEMIGWTNPPDPSAKFDAAEFDTRFNEVSEGLFRMRPWLEGKGSKKGLMRAFLFPEEFSYLHQPLRTVLDNSFKPNIYQETPVCRGVYFSSGTQVGSPLAMALEDMAKDLNVAGLEELGLGMGMQEEKEVRTYFIKDFVSEQVLKDRDMNWRTRAAEQRLKKRRMGWGMVGVAAAALLALFGSSSFFANRGRLNEFRRHLPEAGRPLEVAVGCMKAHDEAVKPGILDVGLNYSDDLMPSFRKTFRQLFTAGVLDPLIDSLKASAGRFPQTAEGIPDVDEYRRTYSHYLYLRDGISGNLPEEYSKATEPEHLEALMSILSAEDAVGGAKVEDLRASIRRFGETAGLQGLAEFRRREVEGAYSKLTERWVGDVDEWVSMAEKQAEGLAGNHEKAVDGLKSKASPSRRRNHESAKSVTDLAQEIKSAASPFSGRRTDLPPMGDLAGGIEEISELRSLLLEVKQGLEPGDALVKRMDALARRLSVPATTPEMKAEDEARSALVAFLTTDVIGRKHVKATYDPNPDLDSLESRRQEILRDLERVGERAFEKIRPHVETLGGEMEKANEAGELKPNPGWWDTFVFLAKAKEADFRMQEYLDLGLAPLLATEDWRKEEAYDQPPQIYKVERIEKLLIPRLREQTKFFENELVATGIGDQARALVTVKLNAFIGDMEKYYLAKFMDAVPKSTERAKTLTEATEQIELWNGRRSSLLSAAKAIKGALWDIDRLKVKREGRSEDPIIRTTQDERRRVFNNFVIFFESPDDDRVSQHTTFWFAAEEFLRLEKSLSLVAGGGLGGENPSEARKLVAGIMQAPGSSSLLKSMEVVRELADSGEVSLPAKTLSDWMSGLIVDTWSRLVELASDDVNDRWARKREGWFLDLDADPSPKNYDRIFGPRGEYEAFREEYLDPFFEFTPHPVPKDSPGARLEALLPFSEFLKLRETIAKDVFKGGGFVTERIEVELGLDGSADPVSLSIEFAPRSKEAMVHGPFRNGKEHKDLSLEWSPEDCQSLRFVIGLPDGKTREMFWEGDWAVAKALSLAKFDEQTKTYIWSDSDEDHGTWEVHLRLTGPEPRLDRVFKATEGENPVSRVAAKMPPKVIVEAKAKRN